MTKLPRYGRQPGEATAVQIRKLMHHVFLTDEAAEFLELSEDSTRRYCSEGRFPNAYRLRKEWLIPRHDVYTYARTRLGKVGRPKGS
jgi:excisionase family DNA binding protein